MRAEKSTESIAVFRALQLGDLLCAVPSFRALRAAYPGARITLIGLPWAQSFASRFSAYLDEFLEFPGWPGLPEQAPRVERIPRFLAEAQARRFDLVIQMQGSGYLTNPLVTLLGARRAAGYYLPGQWQPDEHTFFPYLEGEHEVRVWLKLLDKLGIPAQGERTEFPISAEERAESRRLVAEHGIHPGLAVCLHPGARAAERRWPPEKFAAVGDALSRLGYQVVLTGSEPERALTQAVAASMHAPAINLAGATGLGALAALLSEARLLVSNDTGVSHLATALRVPSVVLFNTTDPARWGPAGDGLHRVITNAAGAGPERVLQEAGALLGKVASLAR